MNNIYKDIAGRTQGDIYIGVVGPVRTGKSTFIKRFMDTVVIPNIENEYKRNRAMDELPQSAGGRTIMTTEPKFVPERAVEIPVGEDAHAKVRMIDCVGYVVDSAMGQIEDENPRMVMTPWSDKPMEFKDAAELGTRKVINDHSTVGIVVTTDGSITDIPRAEYEEAEERVIGELKDIRKPFVVLLNSADPYSEDTINLAEKMEEKYGVSVIPVNCLEMTADALEDIMAKMLFEFPVKEIGIEIPDWIEMLDDDNWLKKGIREAIVNATGEINKISDIKAFAENLEKEEFFDDNGYVSVNPADGTAILHLNTPKELFYRMIDEQTGFKAENEGDIMKLLMDLAGVKKEYDKIAVALSDVERTGYGIVTPEITDLTLEEPEIVKQGSRFGVRLKASAPSLHLIRADIETEVSPIVGTEKQSEELVHYLLNEFENDPKAIWQSNIFGKSLHELVNEGLNNKLYHMPEDARIKLRETLTRIINEGSGGLICIIL